MRAPPLGLLSERRGLWIGLIYEHSHMCEVRDRGLEELEPLRAQFDVGGGKAGDVPAGTREIVDQPDPDWIGNPGEHDWNAISSALGCLCRWGGCGDNHVDLEPNQFGGE